MKVKGPLRPAWAMRAGYLPFSGQRLSIAIQAIPAATITSSARRKVPGGANIPNRKSLLPQFLHNTWSVFRVTPRQYVHCFAFH